MMIRRRTLLLPVLLLLPMLLTRCAPPPPPPAVLDLTIVGGAGQNPDAAGKASPVAVRIFQLTATAKFERADVFAMTEREKETLGQDSAGSEEFVILPGETRKISRELKHDVQALGAVVLFRAIDTAKWRAFAPVASSGPSKLVLGVGPAYVTLGPP